MRDAKVNNVALFVDIGNLYYCVNRRYPEAKLDYQKLLTRAKTYGNLIRAFAYGSQVNEEAVNFITCLKAIGYDTKYKRPKVITTPEKGDVMIRANWNVGITIDVVNLVVNKKCDIIILASSNPELIQLIQWVKTQGIRCLLLACGIPKDLKEVADQYTEIDASLIENKAETQNEVVKTA